MEQFQGWVFGISLAVACSILIGLGIAAYLDLTKYDRMPDPKIGEHWIYQFDKGNPFNKNTYYLVDNIQDGFVEYVFVVNGHVGWSKNNCSIKSFKYGKERINDD